MRDFYNSLSEKDRRSEAAIIAPKLGYGGASYIRHLFNCDNRTILHGKQDLELDISKENDRIRQPGAGRLSIIETMEGIDEAFLEVIEDHTAGSPMDETIKWTNLSRRTIANKLKDKGFPVSVTVFDKLLKKHKFCRRQAFKSEAGKKNIPDRDEQFKNIERLNQEYHDAGNPVMSMDVKKKELIGNFFRDGKVYTQDIINVYDHDFASQADGKMVPHGLYDVHRHVGYITLGLSNDTSEFACECIRQWWLNHGQIEYQNSKKLLERSDCGGSNNARYYIFKEDLQKLSNDLDIEIRIAHYPPYTSKYNPIEHRLFSHITRACKGAIFKTVEIANNLIGKTSTSKGLKVFSSILDKTFETGRKYADDFKKNLKIKFDEFLPKWNYVAVPTESKVWDIIKS
ncbi:MAG: ISAzo13 family transposase [Gammaproteobacteria bacterium]|nr:MAG: ISAzo13 family transposase [Gammaproteobacteria bacterium]RKZ39345.1 MAG: ISAzo13 family transposase [Gammaproteobacteria bacterium]RKZ76589.1 MAG: ISAzo13 family transposase [Gammaproteobacteria bacterium]